MKNNKKENGFYIELGAFDGISQSNTAFFEFNRNWKGILIEPSKGSYELCKKNRPNSIVYNYCCVSNDYKEEYISGDFNNITMASVNGNRLKSNDLVSKTFMFPEVSFCPSLLSMNKIFANKRSFSSFNWFLSSVDCLRAV